MMLLNEQATQVQTQAQIDTFDITIACFLALEIALPDALLIFRRKSWSLIAHPDAGFLITLGDSDCDRFLRWRIFERICYQIGENLADAPGIDQNMRLLRHLLQLNV